MADCSLITYKDIKIVYTDVSGTVGEEAIPCFLKSQKIAATLVDGTMLSLVNVKDIRYNSKLLSVIKETVKKNNVKVKATVVCGLNPLTTIMVKSIISLTGRKMVLLDSLEEGKEWLYQQAEVPVF